MRMKRILVIRGGAIGDFILTLPALKALRDACPQAYMEILGYKHIAVLAEKRFYAQAVRSIEYGPLSSFFARNSELPAELANYFASICSNRLSRFIREAAARRKTGRWKSGLLCFREAVISRSTKTNASGPADCLPLSSFQARRIKHRRSYWNASGKIQWSVSPRTYGCRTSPQCLSVRSSLGTIVASRTSPQPRAQIAFCFLY